MKKNRMMRLASVLLVAVLMTTCTISGTFAKYVAEGTGSETARVAKWGFGTTSKLTFDLFKNVYDAGKVASKDGADVIAPGTTGYDYIKLFYAGEGGAAAPEVAYRIDLEVDGSGIPDMIKTHPNIQWKFNGSEWLTWANFEAAVNAYTQDVSANTLPTLAGDNIQVQWQWVFDESKGGAPKDELDTYMGNMSNLEMTLVINFTATQID